jgi:hypothetical protein
MIESLRAGLDAFFILASIARYAIIIYAVFAALTELGIAVQLTAPTFLIVLGAIALAAAIAFGWGGRDAAKDLIERYYDRRDEVTNSGTAEWHGRERWRGVRHRQAKRSPSAARGVKGQRTRW